MKCDINAINRLRYNSRWRNHVIACHVGDRIGREIATQITLHEKVIGFAGQHP